MAQHMLGKVTAGRQIGSGPAASIHPIQQAAAKKSAAPAAAPATALQGAAKRYSGAFSGSLNNLSDQEDRAHAVAARRQADADKYSAYVMGQQGAVAAAAARQDQQTLGLDAATQAATLNSQLKLQAGLGAGRAQQGIGGPVPLQQSAGLVNDQQAGQALMGAVTQQQADKTNTNAGKAQFLQAAAQASLMANKRAIAGDEFNQVSDINAQKTGVLTTRTESAQADKRSAAAAQAASDAANLAHEDRLASLDNAANIAAGNRANSNAQLNARLANSNQQGHLNRIVRLKTAATTAAAGGFVAPKERARRNTVVASANGALHDQLNYVRQFTATATGKANLHKPGFVDALLSDSSAPKAPKAVRDYVKAVALNEPKGKARAKKAFDAYIKALSDGTLTK